MRPALPLACALVVLGWAAPGRCGSAPFGVMMSWSGSCSQPGVPGGAPPASVSGGSGFLAQTTFVAPPIAADCPGVCAPPPLPPDLCTGSRWDAAGSVGLG